MTAPAVQQTIVGDHNIVTGTGDVRIVYELPPAEADEWRLLLVLLERVRQFWVAGALDGSVDGAALLELGTAPVGGAVARIRGRSSSSVRAGRCAPVRMRRSRRSGTGPAGPC